MIAPLTAASFSAAAAAALFSLSFSLLLLAGCASEPAAGDSLALTAAGRLAVRVDGTSERPAQSLSAAFEWRGGGERGELTLISPLGNRLAQARWSPGLALLVSPEGEAHFGSLEALAERALGERIPLAAWPDWLAGRPWPGAASQRLTAGAGAGFEQLGWTVDLSRHAEGRIEARRSLAPAVTVRIVLDNDAGGPARRGVP